MTNSDATVNVLAGLAYSYAVELHEATRDADYSELEHVARQITIQLKAKLHAALEAHQAAPATPSDAQIMAAWHALNPANRLRPIHAHEAADRRAALVAASAAAVAGPSQAEIAGHEAANLHLSAMVDELRELLQDAKRAMTELHLAAIPDESTEGVPAIIPPEAFRKFVDAHAMLCFCMHQRGYNPPQEAQRHG